MFIGVSVNETVVVNVSDVSVALASALSAAPAWEDNVTDPGGLLGGSVVVPPTPVRHIGVILEAVLALCYTVGIAGNLAALVILIRGGKRTHRNRRHSLMLRYLACNDLVALMGMLVMMEAQLRLPRELVRSRAFCSLRVVWRIFGLGSGSVALVMALERWLALTRPFLYQKHITCHVVRRAIFTMWSCVLFLVILPLFGFGLYYDPVSNSCARYPHATKPVDIAYAYVYFSFGMLLIVSILCCNLLVVRRLRHAGHASWGGVRCRSLGARGVTVYRADSEQSQPASQRRWALVRLLIRRGRPELNGVASDETVAPLDQAQQPPIRRFSRNCNRPRALQHSESLDSATHEEAAFAKLMGFLCVLFVLCWLPQMMAIPLTQLWPSCTPCQKFSRVADFSLLLHFTLDPFVYVLQSCTRRHNHNTHPAGAGAGGTGSGSAWPQQTPQSQTYVRKLGASVRLAFCSCRFRLGSDRGQQIRRQDGLGVGTTSALDAHPRDVSLLHYNPSSQQPPHSVAL